MGELIGDGALKDAAIDKDRRNLLRWLGKGSVFAAFAAQIGAAARAFFPNVLYEPPAAFKLRRPQDYPQGYTFDAEHRLFVVRAATRFHVISAVCTHLGCTVQWRGTEFDCPCHGSRFSADGKVLSGPASRALPWFEVSLSPEGRLEVDSASTVPQGSAIDAPVEKS